MSWFARVINITRVLFTVVGWRDIRPGNMFYDTRLVGTGDFVGTARALYCFTEGEFDVDTVLASTSYK